LLRDALCKGQAMDFSTWAQPTTVLALTNLITLVIVVYQLKRNTREAKRANAIKRAEFVHRINDSLASCREVRELLDNNTIDPGNSAHFVMLRDYAILFENIYCLSESGILSEEEVYEFFGARFAEFDGHPRIGDVFRRAEFKDMGPAFDQLRDIVARKRHYKKDLHRH